MGFFILRNMFHTCQDVEVDIAQRLHKLRYCWLIIFQSDSHMTNNSYKYQKSLDWRNNFALALALTCATNQRINIPIQSQTFRQSISFQYQCEPINQYKRSAGTDYRISRCGSGILTCLHFQLTYLFSLEGCDFTHISSNSHSFLSLGGRKHRKNKGSLQLL